MLFKIMKAASLIGLIAISFLSGYLYHTFKEAKIQEETYPWDLQTHLTDPPGLSCGLLTLNNHKVGNFIVEPLAGGKLLRVTTYDEKSDLLTFSIIDNKQRIVSDNLQGECAAYKDGTATALLSDSSTTLNPGKGAIRTH